MAEISCNLLFSDRIFIKKPLKILTELSELFLPLFLKTEVFEYKNFLLK